MHQMLSENKLDNTLHMSLELHINLEKKIVSYHNSSCLNRIYPKYFNLSPQGKKGRPITRIWSGSTRFFSTRRAVSDI